MSNLFDMRCPQCGDEDRIDIAAIVWVRLCQDGTDTDASDNGDHYYDPKSAAACGACAFHGKVADFDREVRS